MWIHGYGFSEDSKNEVTVLRHSFEDGSVQVLAGEERWFKRGGKEAICTKLEKPLLAERRFLSHNLSPQEVLQTSTPGAMWPHFKWQWELTARSVMQLYKPLVNINFCFPHQQLGTDAASWMKGETPSKLCTVQLPCFFKSSEHVSVRAVYSPFHFFLFLSFLTFIR